MCLLFVYVFFFKQKTAYEMRISDWSSDVCSSDLEPVLYEVGGFVMAKRWKRRPAGSNWGEFGDDDELGRLNYLTPDAVLEGVREVRTGIRFGLSLPLELPGGAVLNERRLPPDYKGTMAPGFVYINFTLAKLGLDNSDDISDERICISTQYSTPWASG